MADRNSTPEYSGSRIVHAGPISIGCMAPEARELMDLALKEWRKHCEGRTRQPDDPVYSFAYWLFRWSGLVQPSERVKREA